MVQATDRAEAEGKARGEDSELLAAEDTGLVLLLTPLFPDPKKAHAFLPPPSFSRSTTDSSQQSIKSIASVWLKHPKESKRCG